VPIADRFCANLRQIVLISIILPLDCANLRQIDIVLIDRLCCRLCSSPIAMRSGSAFPRVKPPRLATRKFPTHSQIHPNLPPLELLLNCYLNCYFSHTFPFLSNFTPSFSLISCHSLFLVNFISSSLSSLPLPR
jgi:hypothetical protein